MGGEMAVQPVGEQVLHPVRQAQHHVAGKLGSRLGRGVKEGGDFVVGERRNHRRHEDAHRDPRLAQDPHRLQSFFRK